VVKSGSNLFCHVAVAGRRRGAASVWAIIKGSGNSTAARQQYRRLRGRWRTQRVPQRGSGPCSLPQTEASRLDGSIFFPGVSFTFSFSSLPHEQLLTSCLRVQNSTAFSVERLDGHVRFHPITSPFMRHQDYSSDRRWKPERDSRLKGQRASPSGLLKRIDGQESPPLSRGSSAAPDASGSTSYSSRAACPTDPKGRTMESRDENQAVGIHDASASCSVFSTYKKLTSVVKDAFSRVSWVGL
jgi:hypothetical protein